MIQFYIGFRSYRLFIAFFNRIASTAKNISSPYHKPADADSGSRGGHPTVMLLEDELFMVLCRIRLGLLLTDLGVCFNIGMSIVSWAHFLSLARSKLRLCSANHRPGYWSNLPCDWPSTAWAYSEQETENGPRILLTWKNLLYRTLGWLPIQFDRDTIKGLMTTCFKNT